MSLLKIQNKGLIVQIELKIGVFLILGK